MTITAADVNKLRQQTGAGLMDCKRALVESNGDFDAAIDHLRKKGQKLSAKRADRDAKEGVVIATTDDNSKFGVIVNLSCETDFVAKNEDFVSFAQSIADLALQERPASKEDLLALSLNGTVLGDKIIEQIGKIGEKIEIAHYANLEAESVVPYIHANYKIGVLTAFNMDVSEEIKAIGRDVSMQIAAMSPIAVDESEVDEATKAKELEIGREQALAEGKPEKIIDKIAQGKLMKFYKERTLVHQQFVKDSSKNVGQAIKDVDSGLAVKSFVRVGIGS